MPNPKIDKTYRFGVRPLLLRLRLKGRLGGHGVQRLLPRRHLARKRVGQGTVTTVT